MTVHSGPISLLVIVAIVSLMFTVACGGGNGEGLPETDSGEFTGGEVRGFVVEAVGRNLAEIESFSVRDELGRIWDFTTEGPVGTTASHLRQHQITGDSVRVVYFERDGLRVATLVEDASDEHGPVGGGGI